MWHAKPKYGYDIDSTECVENVLEINGMLNNSGYTLEAQAGLLGCVYGESGMNPWRWQNDEVVYTRGYGLFQFTPARGRYTNNGYVPGYFIDCENLSGFAPNNSVSETVSGALPSDGYCQVNVVITDFLRKWTTGCWRDYWDSSEYPALYAKSRNILNTYGSNGKLTQGQFATITDIGDATLAFLACYEGPAVPDYNNRLNYANTMYSYLSGVTPPPPTPEPIKPPIKPTVTGRKLPFWMMCRKVF